MSELASAWESQRVQGVTVMLFNDGVHETQDGNHIMCKDAGYCAEVREADWWELSDMQKIELVCEAGEHIGLMAEAMAWEP